MQQESILRQQPKEKTHCQNKNRNSDELLFIRPLLFFSLYYCPHNESEKLQHAGFLTFPKLREEKGRESPESQLVDAVTSEEFFSDPAIMAYQQVAVELVRDGPYTPWGFRMTGGADIGAPMVIQKITFGSPSEGELQKGDILLKIRDKEASRLSHQIATDLITKAGSTLKLVVARNIGGQNPRGVGLPYQSTGPIDGHQNALFKPLPTTNFGGQRQRRSSAESYTSTASSDTERDIIVNQPFRSSTLILPAAKISKDIPVGSYLRFDPLAKRTNTPPLGPRDPYMLTRVQEALLEAAQTSSGYSSPGRTPTPDIGQHNGPQVCIKQYNSPINMYSNQAIVEALAAQSVSTKTPHMEQAQVLEAKKLSNIKESPTYQLIHEEEWKRGKVQEYEPLKEHVYDVFTHDERSDIHQSTCFKGLMHDLKGLSDF